MSFTVVIVGRPNVGKSTLFNKLTSTEEAIVDPTAGVTRDRKYGIAEWLNYSFIVIDTGGIAQETEEGFDVEIKGQVSIAIHEASLVLFLVDGREGLTDADKQIGRELRKVNKPILVVCNKIDTADKEYLVGEFYGLGFTDEIFAISANNGYGTGEMLDHLVAQIEESGEHVETEYPKIAIVGRPNVGKSSLLNALTGEERAIVSEVSGTTRDIVNTTFRLFNQEIELIDTAGLRKKRSIDNDIEFYSSVRTIKAIRQSDACLLLIDAEEGITQQDLSIFREIEEANKGVVLLVNKWDLVEKDHKSVLEYTEEIKKKLAPYTDVPIFFTSTVTKQRILKALEKVVDITKNRKRRIPTSKLNEVMLPLIQQYPPPVYKGKEVKIKFVTQLPTRSPAIAFFCNSPASIKDSYQRFLENKIREHWDFSGIPVRLYFRQK